MALARFLAELFVFARSDWVMVVFLQVFLQNYFVVITTNYIVVQSSDAYPPP